MAFPLRQILQLSDMVAKIVRDNFTDISSWFGDLQNQINLLLTPPAGNEVTNARDFHVVLRDRIRSGSLVLPRYMVSGGLVDEDTGSNMKVSVALGEAVVSGVGCVWAAQTSGLISAPSANPRWDTVVINSDNTISIATGSESATPVLPSVSATQKKLAHIYLTVGMTAITTADIRDARKESYSADLFVGASEQIGTIKAWHKSFASVTLEEEYKECDGTDVDDPESPYYGLAIPDLNGGARFLKGAATSGTLEASANKAHTHDIQGGYITPGGSPSPAYIWASPADPASSWIFHSETVAAKALTDGATDAVPKNMSVVWIMRIK